ncbi:MAG TPA: hypothetical protein PKB14_11090 [Rubrivivax sp.]|nr:hypothetical protein [Rubrivivax sp.]
MRDAAASSKCVPRWTSPKTFSWAAKELARRERSSTGAVISRLARQSSSSRAAPAQSRAPVPAADRLARLRIRVLPHRGGIVTKALIDRLRGEEGI